MGTGLFTNDETLFTNTFTGMTVATVSGQTGLKQIALKNLSGTVRFIGNATQIAFSINGSGPTPVDSDWVNVDSDDDVAIVAIDGVINVNIDASLGSVKMMAIQ